MLDEKETDSKHIYKSTLVAKSKDCGVWIKDMVASWTSTTQTSTLKNISFEVVPGELLVIIGNITKICSKFSF